MMRLDHPTQCSRCGSETLIMTMSVFNTSLICPQCAEDEKRAPHYKKACNAELREVGKGVEGFQGIGLSKEDAEFLEQLVAERGAPIKVVASDTTPSVVIERCARVADDLAQLSISDEEGLHHRACAKQIRELKTQPMQIA
jgi:hypothetical protein